MRVLIEKVKISFLRLTLYPGKKQFRIMGQSLKQNLLHKFLIPGYLTEDQFTILFCDDKQLTMFNTFQVGQAWNSASKALQRGNSLVFEKKLKCDILSIIVEPKS